MKYYFNDPVCPNSYDLNTLKEGCLGGTEATVLRVTEGLSQLGHQVAISQRGRDTRIIGPHNLEYLGLGETSADPDVVITLRDAGVYGYNRSQPTLSRSKHYLWLHDVVSGEYITHLVMHLKGLKDVNIICVSNWHMLQVKMSLAPQMSLLSVKFHVINNPVAEYCRKENSEPDPFKLVFFSSPHKGLFQVLHIFNELHKKDSRYHLTLANPGYYPDKDVDLPGVTNLGSIPHKQVINEVRGALCTLYPQSVFAETFGLVLAESNAVGTPVICHNIGAAPEILDNHKQFVDGNNISLVVDTVIRWSNGERPVVMINKNFLLDRVVKQWLKLA